MKYEACAAVLIVAVVATTTADSALQQGPQPATIQDVQSLLDRGLYARGVALAQTLVDSTAASRTASPASVSTSDVLVRALVLNGEGSLPGTIALAEQALQAKRAQFGPLDPRLAPSLINLGNALGEAAEHTRSTELLEQAVALSEGRGPTGRLALTEALDALGAEHIRAGRYELGRSVLARSLVLRDEAGQNGRALAVTLESLSAAFQWIGDYGRARPPLERALALHQAVGPEHPAFIQALNLLGRQLWFEGTLSEARDASARAVDLAERTLRPDHPTTASSLRNLAATVLDLGDVSQARSLQQRALGIAERSLGSTHHEMGVYLNSLANSNIQLGAYTDARAQFEKALVITEARLGSRNNSVATIVHNLALVDASLGDYARARQRQARATEIWERVLRPDHPFVAVALTELAAVHREQGAPSEALPLLQRALAIRERSLGPDHRDVARTLADLAATLMQLHQGERAQALAARSLRILERVDARDTPDLATVLDLYAQLQLQRGDSLTARQYFERALAIREKLFGPSHPAFAETQARLAMALADLGNAAGALRAAAAAETTGREHLRLMLRSLPERQSLNYAATRPRGLDLTLSLVSAEPNAPSVAMDALVRSRALVLDEMAGRRSPSRSVSEAAAPLAAELARSRQRLANLVVRGPGALTPVRHAALVEEARQDSERAEQRLAEQSATFSAELHQAQIGLEEVRVALPAGSAFVSFVRYERTVVEPRTQSPGATIAAKPSWTVTAYLAFVLKPGQPPVAVPLGSSHSIDTLVKTWTADIAAEPLIAARTTGATRRSSRVSGAELRRLVWDPVARHIEGVERIFIVPDGALSLVPFAALPVQQSAYLVEQGPVIHYVSAERDLVSLTAAPVVSARGLLALGGAAFDDRTLFGGRTGRASAIKPLDRQSEPTVRAVRSDCESLQGITFPRLDGSLQEVKDLAKLWNAPDANSVRVLVGREASERSFKEEASRYRVLHLATHGFFLGESCERSGEGQRGTRAVGGLATASTGQAKVSRVNPLLLSGLALAGANRRSVARPDEDDGILTAEEVASLNLGGVEWAVLSACNTGLGEIKAGEGVFGLRRAFQVAGARTVIMSLWSVDDQATRAWMRALYEGRFQKNLSTADAVHNASIAVLRERRAKGQSTLPFYWAAFVAAGDWR